jgi:membrane dipeptidase
MTLSSVRLFALVSLVALAGCSHDLLRDPAAREAHAVALARSYGIIDTHIDAPSRFLDTLTDVSVRSTAGEFDYVRAREGGLLVPFMSVYTSSDLEGSGTARHHADALIDVIEQLPQRWPDKFAIVRSTADVERLRGSGRVLLALGMENGSPLEGSLDAVRYFYDRGIRYITLAHAKWNHLCDGSYDTVRHWNGLSPFGRQVIAEMNRLGIMVDVSHLTDSAAAQAIRLSTAPVIASHSSCRVFTPGFERNISDDLIRLVAARGGVVQVTVGSFFLTEEANTAGVRQDAELAKYLDEHHVSDESDSARAFLRQYRAAHPYNPGTIGTVADHIDHIVKIAGIDYVGIGSDYEGVGKVPPGLEDVSCYPHLIDELLRRGYTDEMIGKICSGNLLRVWAAVERGVQ